MQSRRGHPYRRLWLDTLHALIENHRSPVLFAPWAPTDLGGLVPPWRSEIRWLLLDCPEAVLRERLGAREGWTEARIQEAIVDASQLRDEIAEHVIDTASSTPTTTARAITNWLSESRGMD